jgi:hypothetical protein
VIKFPTLRSREEPGAAQTEKCLTTDGRPGFNPRQRQRIFPLASASRPALGPTQPSVQWVPESFPRDQSADRRDADHSPPSSAEVKNE